MAVGTEQPLATAPPRTAPDSTADQPKAAPQTELAVEVDGAGKQFDRQWVVQNLSFTVAPGTIFGLFGPSGSGKTTTLRLILGLLQADAGEVRVLGTSPRRFRARTRARIGYLPQLFVLYPELSVGENLDLVASLYGLGWLKRRKAIARELAFVELSEHRRKVARDLSGGMKRRLELAAALVHDPDLLVVDEPTAGIDPVLRKKFWDHFHALRGAGKTIIVTSQYLIEAEYCDQVGILGEGQLVAQGTPQEVRERAFGGEIVDVVADALERRHVALLGDLDGVRIVRPLSYEHLQVTVDRAADAIPLILETLNESGAGVKQVDEYRPDFDEVFVRLMEQASVQSAE